MDHIIGSHSSLCLSDQCKTIVCILQRVNDGTFSYTLQVLQVTVFIAFDIQPWTVHPPLINCIFHCQYLSPGSIYMFLRLDVYNASNIDVSQEGTELQQGKTCQTIALQQSNCHALHQTTVQIYIQIICKKTITK